jgi:hypothetical protein
VKEADLKITKGGNAEAELSWALDYADRIDPLTDWRRDIGSVLAEHAGRPCPKCGKVHGAEDSAEQTPDASAGGSEPAAPASAAPLQEETPVADEPGRPTASQVDARQTELVDIA